MLLNRVNGPSHTSLSRRDFLRGTLGGVTGLAGWQYGGLGTVAAQKREPGGQMTWAVHFSLAPSWFDPAETPGIVSPFLVLYALHDSLVKPMPGQPQAGSLAESWSVSADGLVYEFVLRQGVKFHNGDPVTTEDVKFSFDRYKGAGATIMKARMAAVEVVDQQRIRFRLKQPWADFMTFFGTPATGGAFTEWISFLDQWDPKSPWADRRVRLAANHAIDRKSLNDAEYLGLSKITASIIPSGFEFAWSPPTYAYDPQKAKQLLAEAGYPNGFDAGQISADIVYAPIAEAVANYLQAVRLRIKVLPMERAAAIKAGQEKKLKNLARGGSASFGNAATRIEVFVFSEGMYAYGSYPDIDGLFREQAAETDRKKREAVLHKIQQLMHEKAMYAPLFEPAFLNGYGPRVAESGLGLITYHGYSAPYEDVRLKPR